MRTVSTAVIGAAALAISCLAGAQTPEPKASPKADKKICRSENVTGSIMPHRTCHTASEWKQQETTNAANADAFRNRPLTTGGTGRQ